MVITDDAGRSTDDMTRIVEAALRGGATAIQYREKRATAGEAKSGAQALRKLCAAYSAQFVLNADLLDRVALEPDDAVHLNRKWLEKEGIMASGGARKIGYSAHSIQEAESVKRHGMDYVTLSPVFPTPSKAGILGAIGVETIRAAAAALEGFPILALGGITAENARECVEAGACGVAVMRAVMAADNAEAAARQLVARSLHGNM